MSQKRSSTKGSITLSRNGNAVKGSITGNKGRPNELRNTRAGNSGVTTPRSNNGATTLGTKTISGLSRSTNNESRTTNLGVTKNNSTVSKLGNDNRGSELGEHNGAPVVVCAPCLRDNNSVTSEKFCRDCGEPLCLSCVQQHRKFPTMKNHDIQDIAPGTSGSIPGTNSMGVPVVLGDKCHDHNNKVLDMFCNDHDAVYCAACIAINHRKCKGVEYLPEAAKDIAKSQEYIEVIQNMEKLKSELETLYQRRQEDTTRLTKERDDATARIKYTRKKINKLLDGLETMTLEKLESEYIVYNKQIDSELAKLESLVKTLETKSKQLKDENQMTEAQMFIEMRRSKQTLIEGEIVLTSVSKTLSKEQIQFMPDTSIQEFVKGLKSMGSFGSEQRLFTANLIGQYDVRISADISDCQIQGSDVLPDGRTLLADWENKKVKLLSTSYKVEHYLNLPGPPYSICCVDQNEAVSTITNKKLLQYISIDNKGKMFEGRRLKVGGLCRDIVCNKKELYVVCGGTQEKDHNQVKVYSIGGQFLKAIVTDSAGKNLFKRPLYIAVNSVGNIYVSEDDNGIIAMDNDGNVISKFADRSLKYPNGLSVIANDQVVVCGFGTHNVVQIGRNGIYLGEVLKESAGLRNPKSICFDVNSQRMIVTCKNTNFVRVFSLK